MKITAITNPADLHKFVKAFYEQHATALNEMMPKLPEAVRTEMKTLYDSLNESLKALPPLEQVPAAQEAGWAFNAFADAMVRMQEYAGGLLDKLRGLKGEVDTRATALNGFEDRLTKGELLPKDKVKELCDLARSEGAASRQPEVVSMRKSALELAGLPIPGDDVLGLPADQYQTRFTAAQDNIAKLAAKGLKLGGKGGGFVKTTAWMTATEFAGQLTNLEELIPTLKAAATPDPLLGAPAQTTPSAEKAPLITLA